jgi:hypothetical protein
MRPARARGNEHELQRYSYFSRRPRSTPFTVPRFSSLRPTRATDAREKAAYSLAHRIRSPLADLDARQGPGLRTYRGLGAC